MGKPKRGKGSKGMAVTDAGGVVLCVSVQCASPNEGTLVEKTVEERLVGERPESLSGDKVHELAVVRFVVLK